MKAFPEFEKQIMIKIFDDYDRSIRQPMNKKKQQHIKKMQQRKDYDQILCLKNQDEADFLELRSRSTLHMGLEEEFNRHLRIGNREETNSEFITAHANNGLIRE